MTKQTSLFENGLIWFGAGVSIAEIMTGCYLAPLGFKKGVLAILLGHLIGCGLLVLAGVIGGSRRRSAMESTKISFGKMGGLFFSLLNVLQLLGWTGIMIYDGALAADGIFSGGHWIWCLLIGSLIVLWILLGITNLGKINRISMAALLLLSVLLCFSIFQGNSPVPGKADPMSFGAAVELSVAMPLSWLPLISDYTREARDPKKASLVSSLVYGLISCWMYFIGLGAALLTGTSDISQIMGKLGPGILGLVIIILSTVTTTFLDAYSAGISWESLFPQPKGKLVAIGITALGTVGAICLPMDDITDFLYLIGSVFAPMMGVQIAEFYFQGPKKEDRALSPAHLLLWLLGFLCYRFFMTLDFGLGSTLPAILLTVLLTVLWNRWGGRREPENRRPIGDG